MPMELTVKQSHLSLGLQTVSRAVSSRTTLPLLTGILLEAVEGCLCLTATSLDVAIHCSIPATVERSGSIVLPARYLTDIVRRLEAGDIAISVPEGQFQAVVTWGRSEFVLNGYSPEQYPPLPDLDGAASIEIDAASLQDILAKTLFAASSDDAMPILTGARLSIEEGLIQSVASDGFRISVARAPLSTKEAGDAGTTSHLEASQQAWVIPREGLQELQRVLAANHSRAVTMSVGKNQVGFHIGDVQFFTRLLEGQYPRVLDMVPSEYPISVQLPLLPFHDACERASLMADRREGPRVVNLRLQADKVIITSDSPEVGKAYEEVAASLSGEPIDIMFQAPYLLDGLKHAEADTVVFDMSGPFNAARIRPYEEHEECSYMYIVLPLRPTQHGD